MKTRKSKKADKRAPAADNIGPAAQKDGRTAFQTAAVNKTQHYSRYVQRSRLELPANLLADLAADGWHVVWTAETCGGSGMPTLADAMQHRLSMGYQICRCDDFAGDDGVGPFAPFCEIADGPKDRPVKYGGLVLMIVRKEIARASEIGDLEAARASIAHTEGYKINGINGVTGGAHPTALAHNRVQSSFERLSIPK